MTKDFVLPELGENIINVDVTAVLVNEGDTIAVDDSILEIETEKSSFDVPSTVAGIVKEIRVKAGGQATVGQVVLVVEESAQSASTTAAPPTKEVSIDREDAFGLTPEPSKSGIKAVEEEPAQVAEPAKQEVKETKPNRNGTSQAPRHLTPAAPSTRRLAREIGVDIDQVPGSGSDGRISLDDVKAYAKNLLSGTRSDSVAIAPAALLALSLPDFSKFGSVRREPFSNVRKATASQMQLNWSTIPMVTQFDKADITDLENLRKEMNTAGGPKVTITAILLKVLASALKKFPQFNASLDMATGEVVYKEYFNIGVAVDTERGLLVPVVRDAARKNIAALAGDLNEIADKARQKKIRPEDMAGACMTITNLGGIGGYAFTPIVNFPEVAILGVSKASMEPVYIEDTFYARLMMPLCVTYDHRLIDGADAARFLRWICRALENPAILAFEG